MAKKTYNTKEEMPKAILVLININGEEKEPEKALEELASLALSCEILAVDSLIQNLHEPVSATLIGSGKLLELKELCEEKNAELVIFDNELSGMRIKNIENEIGVKVLTRSMVILDIFARRAQTAEGKLQTEIAQLKYMMPRLIGMEASLGGKYKSGVGMRGPGETKLELDRRKIKDRIIRLENDLKKLEAQKNINNKARIESRVPGVAIVGYTNAGKSTLFNLITKAEVLSKDMLFATLETVTRYVYISDKTQIVLSDTVGFINKLPHEFVSAFKSTLREAATAKLLLIICDAGSRNLLNEFNVVLKVLGEIGASNIKRIVVLNKLDSSINEHECDEIEKTERHAVRISALKNSGVEELKKLIEKCLNE